MGNYLLKVRIMATAMIIQKPRALQQKSRDMSRSFQTRNFL